MSWCNRQCCGIHCRLLILSPVALLFAAYALCMFALYSFMPVVIKLASATAVNLSMLTADLFSLFFGLFLFHYKVSWWNATDMEVVGVWITCSTSAQQPPPHHAGPRETTRDSVGPLLNSHPEADDTPREADENVTSPCTAPLLQLPRVGSSQYRTSASSAWTS
ncbi:UNVERIFIED_CONTAM: hypothetical protein FKN15_004008 [Acipenser sinensis]